MRRVAVPGLRLDPPAVRRRIVVRSRHAGAEADAAPEVHPVRYLVEVAEDLALLGVPLRPLPLLQHLLREGVAVGLALGIAPGAGVAFPVPGAAHAVPRLQHLHREAEPVAQAE